MSFEFDRAAWLQQLEKKQDCFGVQSLLCTRRVLENHSNPTAPVRDEGQAPSVASAVANDVQEHGYWDFKGVGGLDDLRRVGAYRH